MCTYNPLTKQFDALGSGSAKGLTDFELGCSPFDWSIPVSSPILITLLGVESLLWAHADGDQWLT